MNEHLTKAHDAFSFVCDDLHAAHAKANPVLALVLNDLMNEAVTLRGRLGRVMEAAQAEEKQRRS